MQEVSGDCIEGKVDGRWRFPFQEKNVPIADDKMGFSVESTEAPQFVQEKPNGSRMIFRGTGPNMEQIPQNDDLLMLRIERSDKIRQSLRILFFRAQMGICDDDPLLFHLSLRPSERGPAERRASFPVDRSQFQTLMSRRLFIDGSLDVGCFEPHSGQRQKKRRLAVDTTPDSILAKRRCSSAG